MQIVRFLALARLPGAALCALLLAPGALAQPQPSPNAPSNAPSNADVFGQLAAACLRDVPLAGAVRLDVAAPYLRSALGTAARRAGAVVTTDTAAARLAVVPEAMAVGYARAGRARLRRTVTARFRLTLDAPGGVRLHDAACAETASDEMAARARRSVEDAAWPETVGTGPGASPAARAAQTGVAAAAVVVSTLLLFSLRSR